MKRQATFSDEIKRAIRASGLTVYRLAKLSGVDKSVISRFLSGKMGMHTENLDKVAAVLGLRVTTGTKAKGRKERRA